MSSAIHSPLRHPSENHAAAEAPPEPYPPDPRAYLRDELARIALLVRAYLLRAKSAAVTRPAPAGSAGFPPECEAVLREEFRWDDPVADPDCAAEHAACVAAADRLDRRTVARLRRTRDDVRLRLPGWELARRFGLVPDLAAVVPRYKDTARNGADIPPPAGRDSLALDLLFLSLLVDRFPGYRAAVAAADRDAGAGGLAAETALRVLQPTAAPAELRWTALDPTAPLLANDLLVLRPGPGGRDAVRIDPRVAAYLVGDQPAPDPQLGDAVSVTHKWRPWESVRLDPEAVHQLRRLSEWWWGQRDGTPLVVLIHGAWGTPFGEVVQAFVTRESSSGGGPPLAWPVLTVDATAAPPGDWAGFVRRVYREAVLRRAAVLWEGADAADGPAAGRWEAVLRRAEQVGAPTFLAAPPGGDPNGAFRAPHRYLVRIDLPALPPDVRRTLWKSRLRKEANPIAADDTPAETAALDLLEAFDFSAGEIDHAVAAARGLALTAVPVPDDRKAARAAELLAEACRRQAARRPVSFARRVSPPRTPADLAADPKDVLRRRVVLPAAVGQQLAELLDRMAHLGRVHHDLGLGPRTALGRGAVALFSGPPGTGKTLAATTLAGLLRKDLYKVDGAAVASHFVGETEKNLARVFAEVQGANAVLFFDEADALFGRRGEVVNASDRWANLQVSYLLERVEEYTGTVILATNHRENLDPAFTRRLQVIVEFPRPVAADRLAILEGLFADAGLALADPARAALRPIADRFELTGGNLKNVVLDAAFRAVARTPGEAAPAVTQQDLLLGVAREYQKEGKPLSVVTFGKDWFAVVERELRLGREAGPRP